MNPILNHLEAFVEEITPASKTDIKAFFSKARIGEFQKGELFVREGEVCHHLLFIHRGLFRYYLIHEGKDFTKDFAVDSLNPFCTSYTSFMLQKSSEIWIEALETSQVLIWERSDILPLLEEHPLWMRFAKEMAQRLYYRKEKREVEFLKLSAEERYKRFLTDYHGLAQRIPQYHIAAYLGITPESLSRIRNQMVTAS